MKLRKFFVLVSLLAGFFFASCSKKGASTSAHAWMQDNGKIKILCTTAMVQDIVSEVAGSNADCLTLIQGENDPHSYQLVKGDDEKFARADIIFSSGLGLEHGPSLKGLLEGNKKAYSIGHFLASDEIILVDGVRDPHAWMDVSLWASSVPHIADVLIKYMPQEEEQIRLRMKALMAKLAGIDSQIRRAFKTIPEEKKFLVTTHASCNYFTRAYLSTEEERKNGSWKKRCKAPEGLSPESQLSTADIQNLVTYIEMHDVTVAFTESNVNYDALKKVAEIMKKKGRVFFVCPKPLYVDAMGDRESGANTYSKMMVYDAAVISENIGK
jgi:manganese/zinc/iron transport system substrate-binding protein